MENIMQFKISLNEHMRSAVDEGVRGYLSSSDRALKVLNIT